MPLAPPARVLAIETSCDETAAAVVEHGGRVLSSVVASQLDMHGKYGGVVPELASREHLRAIVPVVSEALAEAGVKLADVQAVAVTEGPGLAGALLVGITYAKALSCASGLPLIAVNHVEGHIHAVLLEAAASGEVVPLPAIALVVSGGHTHLFEVQEGFEYRLIGRTRDDAAGEAYDKVARLLGFGYPGGPVLDALAPFGDGHAVRFAFAKMKDNPEDFSFSGLKTGVLRWTQARDMSAELQCRRDLLREHSRPSVEQWLAVTPQVTRDLIASFQRTVIEEIMRRLSRTAEQGNAQSIIVAGGVSANRGLREAARREVLVAPILFPSPHLATDNAVMIAAVALYKLQRREFAPLSLAASPNLTLA